jgi:hypothetical protein
LSFSAICEAQDRKERSIAALEALRHPKPSFQQASFQQSELSAKRVFSKLLSQGARVAAPPES